MSEFKSVIFRQISKLEIKHESAPATLLLTLVLYGMALGACPGAIAAELQEPPGNILAKVDGEAITADDFMRFLARDASRVPMATTTRGKARLLKEMIARELLAAELVEEGNISPEVTGQDLQHALEEVLLVKLNVPSAIPEHELRAYFESNKHDFGIPGAVRLSQIQIRVASDASAAERQAAKARADEAYQRLLAGESFGTVAREMTENPERKGTDGDLGFVWREGNAWLESALAGVSPGEFTEVLESPVGYDIVLLVEERGPVYTDFDDAKAEVERELIEQHYNAALEAYVDDLAADAKIEIVATDLRKAYPNGLF